MKTKEAKGMDHLPEKVIVEDIKCVSQGIYLIRFKRSYSFLPGQVIGITDDPAKPTRMYSIASGDKDPFIDILFDLKEDGYLTPRLRNMTPGCEILVTKPYGSFVCDKSPAYWIGAGTGVAPFVSMALSGNITGKTMIHGARHPDSFYFRDKFKSLLGDRYVQCCSGEFSPPAFHGRVTAYLEQQDELPADIKYYVCGRAEMVVDTRDILIAKGVPYGNIMAEIYF